MKATLKIADALVTVDLSKPIDISIPLRASTENPQAWFHEKPVITPVVIDKWVGKVSLGASVNFNNIFFNPHAHGTHTECVGHISEEFHSVNQALTSYYFNAEVITVTPETFGDDLVIPSGQIKGLLQGKTPEALVIRTLPNLPNKKSKNYVDSNWPYLMENAAQFLKEINVKHLLIDQPSVDKEKDDGKLLAHKAFWNYPEQPRKQATITEFIYVPNKMEDGSYLLNLQVAPFENDAAPSKPILYKFV